MRTSSKVSAQTEFGDFQTPSDLSAQICSLLAARGLAPASVVEPTCGTGNLLFAALNHFPTIKEAVALDINPDHIDVINGRLSEVSSSCAAHVEIIQKSFFAVDWPRILRQLPDPILIIGNPPWVTNTQLSGLASSNLPEKRNFQGHRGLDARTGKSNFDISEWMLVHLLQWLSGRNATLAVLCKSAVARKALLYDWRCLRGPSNADIYAIDALRHFGAAVHACLFVCQIAPTRVTTACTVHPSMDDGGKAALIGFRDGMLVADLARYEQWKLLTGKEAYKWRSGIKHDCSKVLELREEGSQYRNGLGALVDLEPDYLYPMFKGSEIANGNVACPKSWMLVTQRALGEQTSQIEHVAPKTWRYLLSHAKFLDDRASSIYRGRSRFSVFGVGDYSFAPWKVAISALYKKLNFTVIGSFNAKPVVLDDTSYFIGAETQVEAEYLAALLNSEAAQGFFHAFVFWDSKRPITIEVLRRLDLLAVARFLGSDAIINRYLRRQTYLAGREQLLSGEMFPTKPTVG